MYEYNVSLIVPFSTSVIASPTGSSVRTTDIAVKYAGLVSSTIRTFSSVTPSITGSRTASISAVVRKSMISVR